MNKERNNAVIVGIDGAAFRIISPLIKKGKLPAFQKIIDNGVHGILNSTIPPVSPVAWTSLITGKHPAKHHIFDFIGKIRGTNNFRFNTAKERCANPFWTHLSQNGKRVFISGVTMTYPPDPVNGYMVSGLGTPADGEIESFVYPPEFAKEQHDILEKLRMVPEGDPRRFSESDREKDRYLKGVLDQIDFRVKLFRMMWQKEAFDLAMLFFLDTDGVSHYFWKYTDPSHKQYRKSKYEQVISLVYQKVDEALSQIMAVVGEETNILIVSDHGFGPLNRVVFLNNWLESKGYLKFKAVPLKKRIYGVIRGFAGRKNVGKMEIDWEATQVYFKGTVGNIFISLRGREENGTVSMEMYRRLCSDLKQKLLNFKDPETGERVVDNVYLKETLYKGKEIETAPDLVVLFKRGYAVIGDEIGLHSIKDRGQLIGDAFNWTGTHEPEGVFMAAGKCFKQGYESRPLNICDVAPTLLYLLDNAVPEEMDGKVRTDIFNDEFVRNHRASFYTDDFHPSEKSAFLTETEESKLHSQLRKLGYME